MQERKWARTTRCQTYVITISEKNITFGKFEQNNVPGECLNIQN